jgi:hypothetical protein
MRGVVSQTKNFYLPSPAKIQGGNMCDTYFEEDELPVLMIYTQEEKKKIKRKEEKRLKRIFKDYSKEVNELVKPLIEKCAFLYSEIMEAEEQIQKFGSIESYKNGANQWGKKKSASVEVHNIMIKNYSLIVKQLIDLLPKETSNDELDEIKDFIKRGR